MDLPEEDETFLDRKQFSWELLPDGGGGCLVVRNYPVSPDIFDRDKTDLMVRIPAGYNTAGLDMYYVDPPLRLRGGGSAPEGRSVRGPCRPAVAAFLTPPPETLAGRPGRTTHVLRPHPTGTPRKELNLP